MWPGTCLGVTNFPKSDIKHHNIHSFIHLFSRCITKDHLDPIRFLVQYLLEIPGDIKHHRRYIGVIHNAFRGYQRVCYIPVHCLSWFLLNKHTVSLGDSCIPLAARNCNFQGCIIQYLVKMWSIYIFLMCNKGLLDPIGVLVQYHLEIPEGVEDHRRCVCVIHHA